LSQSKTKGEVPPETVKIISPVGSKQAKVSPVAEIAGAVMSCVTEVVALVAQPLVVFVTVTEYVPGTLGFIAAVVALNAEGPDHAYVPPPVAVLFTVVVVHVKFAVPVIVTVGAVISCVIEVVALDVQPFVVFVTVTEYVPGALGFIAAVVALNAEGPDHAYVPPPVAVLATLVVVHVRFAVPVIVTVGAVMSCVIEVVALVVQPFVVLVTVTEYVPGTLGLIAAVVALKVEGPDHAYVPPPVAVLFTVVVVHVRFAVPVIVTVGAVMSCVTEVVALVVQPFVVFVTVTE
jgi:hypothetical protein